jgi:hypothetical protein
VTSSSQTPPLVEEQAPFQNTLKSWKGQKYVHGSRRDTKPKLTWLARASSNLLDHPTRDYSPMELWTKDHCTGEGQQKFTGLHKRVRLGLHCKQLLPGND